MTLALTAISWLLKNWKIVLGALAVLAVLAVAWKLDRNGYQRRVNEEAQAKVIILQGRLAAIERTNEQYASKVLLDSKAISELKRKVRETPKNDSACLDANAARRVQSIR